MTKRELRTKLPREPDVISPPITTYDSGYEHSIEHLSDVRQLTEYETDKEQERLFARLKK